MRLRTNIAGFVALAAALLAAPVLLAQEIAVNAVSYHDMPQTRAISVEMFNDSDQNKLIKEQFESELILQGYTIDPGSRLILSFEVRDQAGTWTGGGPNPLIELKNSDDHTGTDAPNVRLNIFDSQRGGLLNRKRDRGITEVAPSQLRVDASIEDRQNGRRLWQGWTTANVDAANDPTLQRAMVKPIVDNIGTTVRDQKFQSR